MSQTIPTTGGRLNPAALPADLRRELAQLDRRLRWVSFVRGAGSLMFVVLLMAALFLGTDYYFPLPGVIRFAFLSLLCVTGLWLFYQWLILPLSRRRRWPDLAYIIDRAFPDFQERVSSTVELSMLEHNDSAVSEYMTERLRQETNTRLTHVDLWECLSLRTMAIALVSATLLGIVAAVPLLLNSQGYSLLWQRLLTPWVNLDSATNLTFIVEDADRTVPRGNDAMIYAEPHWRYYEGELPREIRLQWTDGHGKTQSREMAYDAGRNAYVGKIPQLMSPVDYVLSSRNARSRTYHINVADRPRIVDVQLTIQPPAYTQVPESIVEGAIGTIRVIEGSRLIANLKFENPVGDATWNWKTPRLVNPAGTSPKDAAASQPATVAQSQVPATLLEEGRAARVELIATQSDQFEFLITSADGLTNIDEPQRMIQIVPDRAPRIDMTGSNDPVKVQPADVIPIELRADDDFGLVDVRIVVEQLSRASEEAQVLEWTSPKTGDDVRLLNDSYELDLNQFDLKSGDILGYRAVARDGRPIPGPNETWTSRRVLMLDEEVKTIAGQEVEEFYESLRRHADIVKNEIAAHRRELESDRKQLDPKPREESKQRVDEKKGEWLQTKLALNLQLDDLSRRLQQRPITKALAQMNVEPAQKLIDDTARALEEFKPVSDNDAMELIRDQETDVREAEKSIDRLLNQLRDAERIEQELTELQQLARRAKELAKDAAKLNDNEQQPAAETEPQRADQPNQQQPLEKLQSEWSTLTQDLENLLKRRPELKQAAKNALLSELSEVAETADELAKLQAALSDATRADAESMTEARQPVAADLQKAREIASELSQRSSEEARKDAAPVFNPTATREAAHEQEQANFGNAAEQLQAAREALDRFQKESLDQAKALPEDIQQAAEELAKRSAELAEEMKAHHDEQRKLEGEAKSIAGEEKKLEAARKANPADPGLNEKSEQLDARKAEFSEQEQANDKEQQKLAERLAGLMQAAAALPTTPQFEPQKRDAVAKFDQGADELAAKTDRADDRVRDASKSLENLARSMGDKPTRDERAKNQLKPIQEQAEQLAKELEEKAAQSEPADPQTGPGLAPRQLEQLRSALRSDASEQEEKLAEAVKTGLEANEQLKANDLKKAAESQKKFAEQLAKLNEELSKQPAEGDEGGDKPEANAAGAPQEKAWDDVPLTPELKALRFPQQPGEPEQLKAELEKLVASQQELNEKTEKAIADNAAPERANELRNRLRQLAGEQRNLAEQTKNLNGESAALPRMNAQRMQRESQKALEGNQPEEATESQQQAKRQLEEALDQVNRELAEQNAAPEGEEPEKSRSEELAQALRNQLDKLSEQMQQPQNQAEGQAPSTEGKPEDAQMAEAQSNGQEPAAPAAEGQPMENGADQPPAGNMPNNELLENLKNSLESLQASQQRLAEQASQLAEQSEVMNPDQEALNQKFQAAAQSAQKASEQLQSGQLRQSEPQAQQASEQLSEVAEMGVADESAQKAVEQLAEQQQQIAEQIQELAQNPQASQLAREMTQEQLQEQTKTLAEAFQKLAEQSKTDPISDQRNSQQLSSMQNQSEQAAGQMQNAQQQSQQGNMQASGQASDQASDTLKRLAKDSAQLANTKRDTLVPEPVGEDAAQASRLLDQAEESLKQAMQQASQQQSQPGQQGSPSEQSPQQGSQPSQQSQQQANAEGGQQTPGQPSENGGQPTSSQPPSALQQLAQQLAQAAQALDRAHENLQPPQQNSQGVDQQQMASQSTPGQPSENSDSTTGNQTPMSGDEKMDGSVLRSALMRDWGQRQEELDADLTDARRRPIDQQYAPLIRSYFESLAQPEPTPSEE